MITRSEYVRKLRKRYPTLYPETVSDEFVYESGREYEPSTNVEDWEKLGYVGGRKEKKPDVDVSPDGWSLLNMYGIDDDSWEWAKHAYANSLSGTIDAWNNGELPYDMVDYEDLGVPEKILSGVASFMMPADVLTLGAGPIASKVVGGVARKAIGAVGKRALSKDAYKKFALDGLLEKADKLAVKHSAGTKFPLAKGTSKAALERAVIEGNTLGMYEAAKAGIQADINGEDVMSAIGHAYAHGSILGAVLGGTGGILEGNFARYKALKEARVGGEARIRGGFAKHYRIPELEKMMKYTGKLPQYAAEVGVLEASSIVDVITDSENKGDLLFEDLIVNAGFVGLMKGKRLLQSKAYEPIAESIDAYKNELNKRMAERDNAEVSKKEKVQQGLEETASEIEKAEPEAAKNIRKYNAEFSKKDTDIENTIMQKIITLDDLQSRLIYSQERAKDDVNVKDSKQMLTKVKDEIELGNAVYKALTMAKKDGKIKGKNIPKVARLIKDLETEKPFWETKSTAAEGKLEEKQTTARGLWGREPEGTRLSKETFETKIKTEKGADEFIAGKQVEFEIAEGKKAPLKKDISITKPVYETGKKTLKNILEKKDVDTAGSDIVRDVFGVTPKKGKFKSGEKYIDENVSEFNQVALQDWIKADMPKSATANTAPFVAKFLNYLGKLGMDVDKLEVSDVVAYINKRRIELGGKTLGPTELSGLSKFTKHLSSKGKFNKVIDYTNVESIFQATNKKLKAGTKPPVSGVRREAIKIGKKLSSLGSKDKGFEIVAELMATFGVRDVEIPHLTAEFLKRTKKNEPYIDMVEREFIAEQIGGREVASIGVAKVKTAPLPLMISEKLAKKMTDYFNAGGKLEKKHYAAIGKKITKSDNKQRRQLDLRPQMQSTVLEKAPELMEQANWILRHDVSRVGSIYTKLNAERAIKLQKEFHKRIGTPGFEAPVKEVAKPKTKVEKKLKAPTPPKPEVETIIGEIKQTKKHHEKIKGKKTFLQKFFSSIGEQEQTIAKKDIIVEALQGEFYKKQPALESLKEFIGIHEGWIERIEKNPQSIKKQFGEEAGDIAWHKKYIDIYKRAAKLLKEAKQTELPYTLTRKKTFAIVKEGQKALGIERKQIGKEAYERNLLRDTKDALGEAVKSLAELDTYDVVDYYNLISSKNYRASESNWRAREATAIKMAEERGFTKKDLEELLKAIDEDTGGKWENVKVRETIDEVIAFLGTHEITKHEPSATEQMINFASESFLKFPGVGRRIVTPLWSLLKNPKIGGKLGSKIADSFLDWDVTNARIRGNSSVVMGRIKNLLGDNAHMLQFSDMQKVKAKHWEKTPDELAFIKRMNDNTKVLNKKTGKKEFKTKERQALEEWTVFRKAMWNKIFDYTRKWTNKAISEKLTNEMSEKFVSDYFTRRLSDDALFAITTLKDQPFGMELAKSKIDEYAKSKTKDMAEKIKNMSRKEGEDKLRFEQRKKDAEQRIQDKIEAIKKSPETIDRIKSDLYTYFNMPHHTVYNQFFFERGPLLPRKMEIYDANKKLKTITTYDESFSGTAEYYGFSMAKYLSTLRHFPEVTELGKQFRLGNWKVDMFDILSSPKKRGEYKQGINHEWADYLSMTLGAHLDMKTSPKQRHDARNNRWLGALSSTGAAAGLSTPLLHGFKNLALGFENSVRHFGMMNTMDGIRRYFDINQRQRLIESGVAEYFSGQVLRTQKNVFESMGLTEKLPGGKWLTMDKIFKINFMTKSEEIARISSAFAGGLYFHQMLDAYKGVKNSFWMGEGKKGNIEDSFRNVFKLSDKEIKWIKDTKYKDFSTKENAVQMASLMQKVEHYSHVSSQGGTSVILLPLWMSQGVAKPLTLFTRIATSVTHDLWMNGVRPLQKHGNMMPLMRFAAASTFSGASLYYFYKHVMQQDQMHELSDDKWKTVAQMLWRAEFLGLFTDLVFNPNSSVFGIYGKKSSPEFGMKDPSAMSSLFQPYMIKAAINVTKGIAALASDPLNPKTWTQTASHIAKNTVSGWNQATKQWDRVMYPEQAEWKGFRTAARSFKKEKGYEVARSYIETARTIYYRDLKNEFWKGSDKAFAKSYYDALSYIDSDMASSGFNNPAYRRKQAMQAIETSLKTMNPVNFTAEHKGRAMSKRMEFLNYLKKNSPAEYKRALKAEKEFNFKLRRLLRIVHQSQYKLRYSPYYDRY